jgi:hypothetical protein
MELGGGEESPGAGQDPERRDFFRWLSNTRRQAALR